ncbi:hypothetical protein [Dactylosporangium salmoneum]|uniref:Lipoprotein n=1 Tax=Dactylosporangium salmoneum TaxID=53361 RepID=A0ABP5TQY8_9ACTN
MNRRRARPAAAMLVLTLAASGLAACGLFGKDKPLQVKAPDDVKTELVAIAQQIFDDAGTGATRKEMGVTVAPCSESADTKDGRFTVVGTWVLFPATGTQPAALIDTMPDKWKSRGWTITENDMINGAARRLEADHPDHYAITLGDNTNGTARLQIGSDCYVPPRRDMVDF